MNERKHQSWNFWSAFFFFGMVVLVGYFLEKRGVKIEEITLKETIVIILASYRMTRILVFEKIFKYFRDSLKKRDNLYLVGTLSSIITCPWCTGVWVTLVMVVFYFLVPYGVLLAYVLAMAGIVSIVILYSNMLHMKTEHKQRIHLKHKNSLDNFN